MRRRSALNAAAERVHTRAFLAAYCGQLRGRGAGGRSILELAATYINTQGTRRRPTGRWAMQYLALEAVRLELGPLRASVRLRARLGVCQVDLYDATGASRHHRRHRAKIVPDFLPRSNEIAGNRRTSETTMRTTMVAVMLLPTCAAYQLAGARPVVHAMAPMGSGRTSVELAAIFINTTARI